MFSGGFCDCMVAYAWTRIHDGVVAQTNETISGGTSPTNRARSNFSYHDAFCSARALREPTRAYKALRRNFESTPFNERVRPADFGFLMPLRWAFLV